ncbi:SDR family oxidoreductase [Solicola sp. PLA-1-18]|uniref:SDR family oxidoreductase n=1 Tax=Solicola sp. PLA-1-18 TaxID=3380532 RepID=UPI003B823A5A
MTPPETRRVVVTGAASGIGRACVEHFVALGDDVLGLDRDADGLAALAADTGALTARVDLLDPASIADLGLEADVVVNNAGFQHVAPVEEFPAETFEQILTLMLRAPFAIAQAVLPGMRERGWGRFVHVSSVHGHRASPYKIAYVTAKHGLEGFSKSLALEGAPHGITSNTVAPGYVRTPLVEGQVADQARAHGIDEDQVVADVLLARSAVKRLVEPDEVARLVGFLCGPGTDSITGATHDMTGGWTAS